MYIFLFFKKNDDTAQFYYWTVVECSVRDTISNSRIYSKGTLSPGHNYAVHSRFTMHVHHILRCSKVQRKMY